MIPQIMNKTGWPLYTIYLIKEFRILQLAIADLTMDWAPVEDLGCARASQQSFDSLQIRKECILTFPFLGMNWER